MKARKKSSSSGVLITGGSAHTRVQFEEEDNRALLSIAGECAGASIVRPS